MRIVGECYNGDDYETQAAVLKSFVKRSRRASSDERCVRRKFCLEGGVDSDLQHLRDKKVGAVGSSMHR